MSLGDTYNNNQKTRTSDFNVYSNYRMNNAESKIDSTCITYRYWNRNLCIEIFPLKETGNDEIQFDMNNGITIYLSHTKARILKNEIELFLKDPVTYKSVGVASGQAIITVSDGSEYGKNTPVITIRKVDETGKVLASFAYEVKTNYHNSVRNYFGGDTYNIVTDGYDYLELEQIVTLLDEYCKSSTNAGAFAVTEQVKRLVNRVDSKVDAIASSLGVETSRTSNGSNRKYNGSIFNSRQNDYSSSSSISYDSGTMDDLE